jgi:hypothetical protein
MLIGSKFDGTDFCWKSNEHSRGNIDLIKKGLSVLVGEARSDREAEPYVNTVSIAAPRLTPNRPGQAA